MAGNFVDLREVGWKIDRINPLFHFENRGHKTDCWIWAKGLRGGYGVIRREGKNQVAHSYFWKRVYGEISEGLELDHVCRIRSCINPSHLEAVTHEENCRRRPETILTESMVAEIRRLRIQGMRGVDLAQKYGVTKFTISKIIRGKMWKGVGDVVGAKSVKPRPIRSGLTEEKVSDIRRRYAEGEKSKTLASEYGVGQRYIRNICARRWWK